MAQHQGRRHGHADADAVTLTGGSRAPFSRTAGANWSLLAVIAVTCLALSGLLALSSYTTGVAVAVAIAVFILCFISTEASLYVLVFSMLLSPEIGMGGLSGSSGTTAGRGVTIRTEDLLLVVMCFAWMVRMAVHKELGVVRATPLNRPILAYTVACVVATVLGGLMGHVNGVTGLFFVLKYIEYFVVYFIVANNIQGRHQIRRLTWATLITAFIVGVVAVAQIPGGERVSAPFEGEHGEPNTLGGYLLLSGALAGGLLLSSPNRRRKLVFGGLLAFLVVPFLATLSRGSYLAMPFVYMALAVLKRGNRFTMIAAFVLLAVFGVAAAPQAVKDRVRYTFEQRASSQTQVQVGNVRLDTSTSARIESWENALSDWSDSPVWGYGVTGYGFLDAQYPRVMVETGLLGVVTFALLILAVYRQGLSLYRKARDPLFQGLAVGLLAGLTGLLVHAVGANTFIIVRIMEPFWLLVGLVVSAERLVAPSPSLPAPTAGGPE